MNSVLKTACFYITALHVQATLSTGGGGGRVTSFHVTFLFDDLKSVSSLNDVSTLVYEALKRCSSQSPNCGLGSLNVECRLAVIMSHSTLTCRNSALE